MSAKSSCLVLGAAAGLKPENLDVFINSLRNAGYAGSTAIMVYDCDHELAAWLESRGVRVISVPPRFTQSKSFLSPKRISQAGRNLPGFLRRRLIDPSAVAHLHIRFSRYLYFNRFLRRHRDEFSHVFLADTRDIVFQADPFPALKSFGDSLCFFAENPEIMIKDQPFNREGIRKIYGPDGLDRVGGRTVLCSGITGGGTRSILAYLDGMSSEIIRKLKVISKYDCWDQMIHNWLAWGGQFHGHLLHENFNSVAAHLHTADPASFKFDSEGRMLNDDGGIIPMLHQYDRHPSLESLVQKLAA